MQYKAEKYKNCVRFNGQYRQIYEFLLNAGKLEYNEHFHWGRFEWMHRHSYLEADKLTSIVTFKDAADKIVGLITYDTSFDDKSYLIHTIDDKELLHAMVDAVLPDEKRKAVIKVNSKDAALCEVLQESRFIKTHQDNCVLELDLNRELRYSISDTYSISKPGFYVDDWQYQLVIHRGFDHTDIPEKWPDEIPALTPNENADLKVFALQGGEYCAHCGLWYTEGDIAYVEPVITVPQHRKQGLAKAVVYEACNRAKKLGAKRAIVLSDQEFYARIGFEASSGVFCWEKHIANDL
ncbi:MAG: GNAT family N-acetyltransferase [Oscillospiraceae bacterium]|nr:GNAT family N-acetyltransferase [Oscillospiraceae bacterium]